MNDDLKLEDLVAEYVDRCESGERITPESFAATHPESGERLLEALRQLDAVDSLLPGEPTGLPRSIGPYLVRGELGRGGMGLVLEVAHESRPHEPIALKVLSLPSLVDSRAVERFRREGETLAGFRHENVVEVLEVGSANGTPYIAMARVEGESLAALLHAARDRSGDRGRFVERLDLPGEGDGFARAAAIVAPLARAVAAAHERGILHRDIKPGNVVLRPDGAPVLLDFGLASAADANTLTQTGDVIGTPQYMAPEQAQGKRVGAAADIYGLGTVLFEMVSGRPPHLGTDSLDVLDRVRREPAVRLGRIVSSAPRDLETILLRALAFEPEKRYASAAAMADDLEAFAAGRRISARRPSVVETLSAVVRRRKRAVALGAVMTALVVVAAASWIGGRDREEAPRTAVDAFRSALTSWLDGDDAAALATIRELRAEAPDDERLDYLEARIEKRPHRPAGDPVIHYLVSGDGTISGGHAPSALRAYGNAVEVAPGSELAAAITALAALEHDALQLAEHELERASGLLPRSTRIRDAVSELGEKRAAFSARLLELRGRVRDDPRDAQALEDMAVALYMSGDTAAALGAARAAKAHLGDAANGVLIRLAQLLDLDLLHSAAQEAFREVLQANPDDALARYGLAFSLDIEHKARAAAEQLELLVERNPDQVQPLVMLANIYSGANRESCARCLDLYEQHPGLLDPGRTLVYARRIIEVDDKGQHAKLAAYFARRVGVGDALRPALEARVEEYTREPGARAGRRKKRFEAALRVLDGTAAD